METLDYNRLLLVSLWQYNHHGDEGLTPALFEETFGKVYGSHCYEKWTGYYLEPLRGIASNPDRQKILKDFFKETYV